MVSTALHQLQVRGVTFLAPETNYVAPDVNPDRIASGVVIHPGCRLSGAELAIGPGCVIGAEAPATVSDCQLGAECAWRAVSLTAPHFSMVSRLAAGARTAKVPTRREGDDRAGVGIKQTVFMPWAAAV